MSRRIASVWALAVLTLAGPAARAQVPFASDLVPKRSTLARLGLERLWTAVIPLTGTERLLRISRSSDLFFAQTDHGSVHTYNAETGQLMWSASLGQITPHAWPVSSNSYMVFGTAANILTALDRRTGRPIWKVDLKAMPSCGTACDEDRVMVGLATGRIIGYSLRDTPPKGPPVIRDKPVEVWAWQTSGPIMTHPLPAAHVVAFGSSDGRVYVCINDERTALYRIRTGGPIGNGLGAFRTRTLLIPSADHNLYAVDLLTSDVLWTFASGAPIDQEPIIAGEDIFVINQAGSLSQLDPATGSLRWTTPTQGGQLTAVSGSKIYLRSIHNDLYVVDRATGRVLADPSSTFRRAGLNLREYTLSMLNRFDDRMYFGTDSGMIVCLREMGSNLPRLLRDPKALPFGYIPAEGIKLTPPAAPAETAAATTEPDAERKDEASKDDAKPAEDKDKPAPEPNNP
jgi:outer membrane protein assembly factor BamB